MNDNEGFSNIIAANKCEKREDIIAQSYTISKSSESLHNNSLSQIMMRHLLILHVYYVIHIRGNIRYERDLCLIIKHLQEGNKV